MTDSSHDVGEDAFHEIQLSGKQLVFLFMATTVVSVVIFLCGVLVGRGVKAEALNASDTASTPASTAGPSATAPAPAPVASAQPTEPPPTTSEGPLSYPRTLESEKPTVEGLKPETKKPEPAAAAALPPVPAATATAGAKKTTPPEATAPPPAPPLPAASKSGWAVQVVALTDRAAANAVVQRLVDKGYKAFLVTPQAGAPVQNYKVQVGRYSDRAEAEQIKARLKKEEQFEPWILR